MKEHGDMEKTERVKKFRFVPPEKKAASMRGFLNEANSPTVSSQYSFDPEKAWSIRKDVSVNLSSPQSSSLFGYGYKSATSSRYASPKMNQYSRHTEHIKSTSDSALATNKSGMDWKQQKLSWQSGSSRNIEFYNKSNATISSKENKAFDLPTSNIQSSANQSLGHRSSQPTTVAGNL